MSQQELIQTKLIDKICIISLNNPEKRNVLTISMLNDLTGLFNKLSDTDEIRCVVINGEGGKAFSSGYDISSIKNDDMMREFTSGHPLEECFKAIETFPYPVIAMINGQPYRTFKYQRAFPHRKNNKCEKSREDGPCKPYNIK